MFFARKSFYKFRRRETLKVLRQKGGGPKETDTKIAYQNKDIVSKLFGDRMKGKPLSLFGLKTDKRVADAKPTNIPIVDARELRLDNLFELEDGSVAILDYESAWKEENFFKYGNYIMNICKRYYQEGKRPDIHMMVLYTADINQAKTVWHTSACELRVEAAYLSAADSGSWLTEIREGIAENRITDELLMHLILYPLTFRGSEEKQEAIRRSAKLAREIKNREQENFALAGLLVFTDKVISEETRNELKEVLEMTQVGKMLLDAGRTEGRKEGRMEGRKEGRQAILAEMLREGEPDEKIKRFGQLDDEQLQALKREAFALK